MLFPFAPSRFSFMPPFLLFHVDSIHEMKKNRQKINSQEFTARSFSSLSVVVFFLISLAHSQNAQHFAHMIFRRIKKKFKMMRKKLFANNKFTLYLS